MIVSMVKGEGVVRNLQLDSARPDTVERITAAEGVSYVLTLRNGRPAASEVAVERKGNDATVFRSGEERQLEILTIEGLFGSGARIFATGEDSTYQEFVLVEQPHAIAAVGFDDGVSSRLGLAPALLASMSELLQSSMAGLSILHSERPGAGHGHASRDGDASFGANKSLLENSSNSVVATATEDAQCVGKGWNSRVGPSIADVQMEATVTTLDASAASSESQRLFGRSAPAIDAMLDSHGAIQGVVANGGYTDDGRPRIIGSAQEGTLVSVYRGVHMLGSVTADANGEWLFIPPISLSDGVHSIAVIYRYPDGDVSDVSEPYVITVDTINPLPPVVTGIVDDEGRITGTITHQMVTDDNRPTINGSTEPFATVVIYDKGLERDRVVAGADGVWTYTPSTPLADGFHLLSFAAIDHAGNGSEKSTAVEFLVDTRPEQVSIYFADDDVGGVTGGLLSGSTTDDSMPTLWGAATAGGIVKIYEGSVLLGQTTAGYDGGWRFTPGTPLSEGAHALHATVTREATGESAPSDVFNLTVDLTPPDRPGIDSVRDNKGDIQGLLSSGAVTDDDTPTLIGRADAGVTVTIHLGGNAVGSVVAAANGRWRFTPDASMVDGTYTFSVTATDKAGNISAPSNPFEITIDSVAPTRPTIDSVIDDIGATTGAVINGGITDDARPVISGMAEAGCVVVIRDNGIEIGRTLANPAGRWTLFIAADMADGGHRLTVEAVDTAGNISAPSEPFEFSVDTYLPTATVTRIGRDSGFDGSDFLTNDGSAGRAIKGVVSGPLRGDQRVEISMDNGVTWSSVVMIDDVGWVFVDFSRHSESWEVLTRVASDTGMTGEAISQPVRLDVVAPAAPTAISVNGAIVTVSFESAVAVAGDRIYLNDGQRYHEHRLTARDVAAGEVSLAPGFDASSATRAAIIDSAGNLSKFRYNLPGEIVEDFSSTTDTRRYLIGETLVLDTMSVKVLQGTTFIGTYADIPGYGDGKRLYFGYCGNDKLEISFAPASKISFTTDYLHNSATYAFYDIYGNLLQTQSFAAAPLGYQVAYTAPPGALIGSVVAHTTEWGFLDNFVFTLPRRSSLEEDALVKHVGEDVISYQGDGRDEVFVVSAGSGNSAISINGNGGIDTLRLVGSGQVLDMTRWGGGIRSIEVIDMNKGSNNVLKLSLAEVLENGAADLFINDGRVQMKVMGNSGDVVELDDALDGVAMGYWRDQGQVTVAGVSYQAYQHSGVMAEVLVKSGVSVKIGLGIGVIIDGVGQYNEGRSFEVMDGAAGQLVKGRLGGELASGMDLQVSVDGGVTWQSAIVNGTSWAFLDTSVHHTDWAVMTRISDGVNHLNSPTAQSVSLLMPYGAPVITSIPEAGSIYGSAQAIDGSVMTVSLAGTGAVAGDKVHIQWGASTYDHLLTQVHINKGAVTLNVPAAVTYTAQGYGRDFSVTAQIVGQNGAPGALSAPFDVVSTYTRVLVNDTLQQLPVGNEYAGNGFTVTTTGTMTRTAATSSSLAGLTLKDVEQANASFTLNQPADHISLRMSGAENDLGAEIRIFDVNGNLMHEETVFGDATARHPKKFTWAKAGIEDIGSFTVTSVSSSITLDAFTQYAVTHVKDTRDPNLIDVLTETFYGSGADDVVSLSQYAQTYFSQATAVVQGSSGIDTLKLLGGNHQLNLTMAGSKVSSMEIVDISGTGNNVLTLNLSDVLRNGVVDHFHAGSESRVQMMVKGNAGDKVNLSDLLTGELDHGDWVKKAAILLDGAMYDAYQHSALAVELLVQQSVAVVVTNAMMASSGSVVDSEQDLLALLQPGMDMLLIDAPALEYVATPAQHSKDYSLHSGGHRAMHLQEFLLEAW